MCRILIVEDHPHNMRLIEQLLEDVDTDITIDKAFDGRTALTYAKDCSYDLVFMDISLPDMDGVNITAQLKEFEHLKNSIYIVITAHATVSEENRFKSIFHDYISKPIDDDIFYEKLEKWTGVKSLDSN